LEKPLKFELLSPMFVELYQKVLIKGVKEKIK